MSTRETALTFVIGAVDRFSAPFRSLNDRMERLQQKVSGVTQAFGNLEAERSRFSRLTGMERFGRFGNEMHGRVQQLAGSFAALAATGSAAALGLGYAFKTQFVDTASQFERFETILTTLNQGDTGKAKKEMGWISDFAAKTPYELAEVTDSFVKLRSYGLDPTKGLLRTLGDTASSMGKPLEQAVEAIADAVTGENERLKEFGIVARKTGEKIVYSYTDASGKQASLMAKANDRAAIQATLTKIWAEKYGGGMEAQSKTFGGMVSNLSDSWSRFTNMVMSNGVFDWMKGKLEGVLAKIDEMAGDGSLQAWAKDIGEKLTRFFDAAWNALPKVWEGIQTFGDKLAWVADLVGGWDNLGMVLAAAFSGLLGPLVGLVGVFAQLGLVMMATPFGWVAGGIVLLVAGITALWLKWDKIVAWVRDSIPEWMQRGVFAESGDPVGASEDDAPDAGQPSSASGVVDAGATPRPKLGAASVAQQRQEMRSTHTERSESKVRVEVVAPAGTRVSQSGAPVETDTVYQGVAAAH